MVNIVTFFILRHITSIDRNICNFISICCAICFAYFAAKFFVFKSKQDTKEGVILEAVRFVGARIFAMFVEIFGFAFLCDSIRMSEFISKFIVQFLVIVINYFLSKLVVFKKNKVSLIDRLIANWSWILAAVITFIFMIAVMMYGDVGPFGGRSYTMVDSIHQYVPFFSDYKAKLLDHGSMFYTWKVGMGVNFQSLFFYYLASPLNLLVIFFKRASIPLLITYLTVLKITFSAGAFGYYLSRHKGGVKNSSLITAFGVAFAINNYVLGYMWNVMWLDCIMVLPLIILGFERLMEGKSPKMYCLSLAYCLYCNYYIAFMVCIFMVLWFFSESHGGVKKFFVNGLRFAGYSILSAGMTAVSLLTAYLGIMKTAAGTIKMPKWSWYQNIREIFKAHTFFTDPIKIMTFDGGVNLYCGIFVLLLAFCYLFLGSEKIWRRIGKFLLLAVLIISFNNVQLNFIWHGFHDQYGIPNRFSFLYIFVLLTMAYRAAIRLRYINGYYVTSALFLVCGFWSYTLYDSSKSFNDYLTVGIICTVGITLAGYIISMVKSVKARHSKVVNVIIAVMILSEILVNGAHSMDYIGSADAPKYMERANEMEEITAEMKKRAEDQGVIFYREDMINPTVLDEATLNGMNSIGIFCSTVRGDTVTAAGHLGFYTGANEYLYYGACHATNMLLGVKYVYATRADYYNPDETLPAVYESDVINVYEYKYALPPVYMVKDGYADLDMLNARDITNVNTFAVEASGNPDYIYDDVHFVLEPSAVNARSWVDAKSEDLVGYTADNNGKPEVSIKFTVDAPMRYVVDIIANNVYKVKYKLNGKQVAHDRYQSQIFDLGDLKNGDEVLLTVEFSDSYSEKGSIRFDFAALNKEVLAKDYDLIKSGAMNIEEAKDGYLKGTINAKNGGLMFAAIPYDEGWSIYVDGKKQKIEKIQKAFMGVRLSAGEHEIEFKYTAPGFYLGMTVTILSWGVFLLLIILHNVKKQREEAEKKKKAERQAEESENESEDDEEYDIADGAEYDSDNETDDESDDTDFSDEENDDSEDGKESGATDNEAVEKSVVSDKNRPVRIRQKRGDTDFLDDEEDDDSEDEEDPENEKFDRFRKTLEHKKK
ncbi:Uncharacterized membrane protein YfhO [Eubacterium ruminantium]|nr:Uncharacterized membrane protein YfhO [Eubacterium ruminantium]